MIVNEFNFIVLIVIGGAALGILMLIIGAAFLANAAANFGDVEPVRGWFNAFVCFVVLGLTIFGGLFLWVISG